MKLILLPGVLSTQRMRQEEKLSCKVKDICFQNAGNSSSF